MKDPMSNYIVSLSGGKDSTALLHLMLEKGENIHSVVFFDTGWEFPQMADHIDLIERKTGIKIVRLEPKKSFEYLMFDHPIKAKKGPNKGKVHRIGYGWPHATRRWCTREKCDVIDKYINQIPDAVSCIGFASDEVRRKRKHDKRYPLDEYGFSEKDCLKYCKDLGYNWGGLYDVFDRVSCFCCPLQSQKALRKMITHYPDLWQKIVEMNKRKPIRDKGYKDYHDISILENKLKAKNRQMTFFKE